MADKQVHKDALPNCKNACIPVEEKLRDYALNPNHPEGRNKAKVFKRVLGFESQHSEELAAIIRARLPEYPAFKKKAYACGERWTVYIPMVGLYGNLAIVTTGWIFRPAEPDIPALITCFIPSIRKQKKLKKQLGLEEE